MSETDCPKTNAPDSKANCCAVDEKAARYGPHATNKTLLETFVHRMPKFTKRAADQIKRLLATLPADLDATKYMPVVGWMVDSSEANFVPGPAVGLHEVELIPDDLIVECHALRIAYNIPEEIIDPLRSSMLDFSERRFMFVDVNSSS